MRTWIGIGILIFLLVIGICATLYSKNIPGQIGTLLSQAQEAAEVGQWETAAGSCFRAKAIWDRHQKLLASLIDHEPLEDAEQLFSQMSVYLKTRDSVSFCSCCAGLESLIYAISDVHSISWWSLL